MAPSPDSSPSDNKGDNKSSDNSSPSDNKSSSSSSPPPPSKDQTSPPPPSTSDDKSPPSPPQDNSNGDKANNDNNNKDGNGDKASNESNNNNGNDNNGNGDASNNNGNDGNGNESSSNNGNNNGNSNGNEGNNNNGNNNNSNGNDQSGNNNGNNNNSNGNDQSGNNNGNNNSNDQSGNNNGNNNINSNGNENNNNNGNNNNSNGNDNDNGDKALPPPPPTNEGTASQSPPNNGANGNKANPVPPMYRSPPSNNGSPSTPHLAPPSHEKSSIAPPPGNNNVSVPLPTAIGIAAGGLLFVLLILAAAMVCVKRKKKRKYANHQMPYTTGGPGYYNNVAPPRARGQNMWQDSPAHAVNVNNMTPPPAAMGGGAMQVQAQGGWQPSPSPPPPFPYNNSGDMSNSANFSGSHGTPALPPPPPPTMAIGMINQSSYSYEDLATATQGFAHSNLLGQGGFGYVHKGVLPNGKVIAVKSLKSGSGQGDREFQAEVDIISRVHHRHLVTLEGFCLLQGSKMLVYEFIPNKTLEYHLHEKGHLTMDWETRLKIALGSAKGLAYLHEDCHPRIIHRDIKSANILIDECFEAKVADFGLAKLTQDNNTHVSTRVMGTFGYLAPEYASSGKLTEKSDVFSFGVVLLELITGRRPLDMSGDMDESLVDWARPLCTQAIETRNCSQLADPFLETNYNNNEMIRMVQCAAAAIRHSARRRPKMRQIVRALEDDVPMDDLNDGAVRAEQSSNISSRSGGSASVNVEDDTNSYSVDMRKLITSKNNSYESSEFGQTSEYGLNPSSSSSSDMGDNTSHSTLS